MSDKYREYEDFLKLYAKEHSSDTDASTQNQEQKQCHAERSVPQRTLRSRTLSTQSSRTVSQKRTSKRSGHFVPPKQRSIKKCIRQRRILFAASLITLIALVIIIVLICKSCAGGKSDLSVLQGVWRYDQYTEYEFDGNGNGCMCIDETNHFEFKYGIDGSTVNVDFALDYVTDCEYDFKIENDRLTLIGGKGTANPGQEYILKRVQ